MSEPRVLTIDGRRVLVTERKPPIAPTLQLMLEGGRDSSGRPWHPLRVLKRQPLNLRGARSACLMEDHRLAPWIEGFATGSDLVVRYLLLQSCQDCGAVCVRDRSIDTLDHVGGVRMGSRPPERKDHVIGWYTGARPRQRVFV